MRVGNKMGRVGSDCERGAALVTVLFISLLLGTACIALLSAASASSTNNTDALSEYKAYYAAESGLQSSINVFRNAGINYTQAAADPDLSTWIGTGPIAVGSEASYSIGVTDPDNSGGAIIYTTAGTFEQSNSDYQPTRCYPNCTASNRLTFSFIPQGTWTANHPVTSGQPLGSLQVVRTGTGTPPSMGSPLKFRIDYVMSDPRPATRTIRGTISASGAITFWRRTFDLMGSDIRLCNSSSGCAAPSLSLQVPPSDNNPRTAAVYATMSPIQPYRLKVKATGYGPHNSTKQLEAIVQRNLFNDLGSPAAIAMVGPNPIFVNLATISGIANDPDTGGTSPLVPSVTVSDYSDVNDVWIGNLTPDPEEEANDVPDWRRTPAAMDALVKQLKQAAQNSGRYYPPGQRPSSFGDYSTGTGITFVDDDLFLFGSNIQGGGVMVITGSLVTLFNRLDFKGLILILGEDGIDFQLGLGTFTGNLVIAPYDPNNLGAGWGRPRYATTTNVGYSDVSVDSSFNGTSAITDFMLGIAEK